MSNTTYIGCKMVADRMGETNDCTVKALAITAGISYEDAHALMASVGRKTGKGANGEMILKALSKTLNVTLTPKNVKTCKGEYGKRLTPNVFARMHPKGKFYCITRNHALAIVDGKVEDWTAGRKHQIRCFVEVK